MTEGRNNVFHIAFCVDENYFRAMGATIVSIVENNPDQAFMFHVLTFAASEAHQSRLKQLDERFPQVRTRLHLLDTADFRQFDDFLKFSYYSLSIFTRLVIPTVLQELTDRVLYLDADILCVGKLDELVEMEIGDDIAAAVMDVPKMVKRRVTALDLTHREYFNSGVMFINIRKWQEHCITEATIHALLQHGKKLRFPDQDALNIVLNGRTRYLPIRYNHIYDLIGDLGNRVTAMQPVGNAVLLHFAGSIKPWTDWTGHDASRLFRQYHALSPWSYLPLDQQPGNTKEMRMHSRFLFKQGKPLQSLGWYLQYVRARRRK